MQSRPATALAADTARVPADTFAGHTPMMAQYLQAKS